MFKFYVKKQAFCDYYEMEHIWARIYKQLTRFSRFILFKPVTSTMQKINPIWTGLFVNLERLGGKMAPS